MIAERKVRSVEVPPETLKGLRKAYKSFLTKTDAQIAIGVNYNVLDRLCLSNTCSPDTLATIETYLQANKKVA